MTKSKSTHAGRMAVLDFLREEGIQIVPVPHGDRKTGGQIVVMLGDGTWLEFDTQKQVVDWLAEHMARRGVKVHNPSNVSDGPYTYLKGDDGEYHLAVLLGAWKGAAQYDRLERAIRGKGPYPSARMASLEAQSLNRLLAKSRKASNPSRNDADAKRSRRNPSAQSVSANKKYWWLVVAREDGYANVTSHDTRNQMIAESTVQIQATKHDPGAVVIRGNVAMTRKQFREGFQTAYPKLHILEG